MYKDIFTVEKWTPIYDDYGKKIESLIGEGWYEEIGWCFYDDRFVEVFNKIKVLRKTKTIYPDSKDVFKAYRLCDFNKIKAVILGDRPYSNGESTGLAFSCKKKLSPSLEEFYDKLVNEFFVGNFCNLPFEPQLDYLAEQGVLLLNTSLTVEACKPDSHKNIGWKWFITETLNAIIKGKPVVFIPMNNNAKVFIHNLSTPYNYFDWQKHIIETNNFEKINKWLTYNNRTKIEW